MKYLSIGKVVNTHGIKGELRLLSNFKYKDKVFIKGMNIYIGKEKIKETINTYRHHKNFDMITLDGYNNINDVLKYKGSIAYINEDDLQLNDNEYLDNELIDLDVYKDETIIGKVSFIEYVGNNKILGIKTKEKEVMIPFRDEFVLVDIKNKKVIITPIEGMI